MKSFLSILIFIISIQSIQSQVYADSISYGLEMANDLSYVDSYDYFVSLEKRIPIGDSNRLIAVEIIIELSTEIEEYFRLREEYNESLIYSEKISELLEKEKENFDDNYMRKLPFSLKNQIVSNFGLKNYTAADSLRNALYDLYRNESLPDGIDEFFNYDFFKIDSLNIWGYEWFEELPSDRFSSSFTKIVYYVYSTDDEGNDKDQLYRLHVLMYHGNSDKFDYVLTKRLETATNEISGTLWCYTYKEKIDLEKLKMDVMKVINGELNPCLSEKE